jgi:hypothetical protein
MEPYLQPPISFIAWTGTTFTLSAVEVDPKHVAVCFSAQLVCLLVILMFYKYCHITEFSLHWQIP